MAENKRYSTLMNNTLLFAISGFGAKLLSIIARPYLSYALGTPDVVGVIAMLSQVSNLLIPVVSLGVSYAIIRFGLDKNNDKSAVFTNGLVTICLGFLLMLLGYPLVRLIPDASTYIVLVYLCVLASCLRTLCTQFIRARMINRLVAVDGILTSITLFVGYIFYINVLQLGAAGYILAMITSDLLSAAFVFFAGGCGKYLDLRRFSATLWKEMLRYCVPMIPASISFWVINASDVFFVQGMCEGYGGQKGNYWAGLLSTGYFFPNIIATLGSIFYEAWQLSAVTEETDRESFFSRVFRVYASVMFCCAAGIIWLCQPLMFAFRSNFYEAWQFVPFLTLGSLCTCLNLFLNSIYVVYKRSTSSLYTMLSGAVLNLILNYSFIRLFGPVGVAPASFLSLLLVFALRAYSTRGLLNIDFHLGRVCINFGVCFAEIFMLYSFESRFAFAINFVLTFGLIFYDRKAIFSMLGKLLHRGGRKKTK